MKKIIFQGLFISFLFFASWFLLSKINWVSILKVQKITDKTEEKLGNIFWNIINKSEVEDTNPFAKNALDSIVSKICLENNFDRKFIKIHIIKKDEINAFAMPNGHLLVYTGLIEASENQEELSGVICHEIAHIQLNHVMKKLIKEVGLSTLISMTSGGGGSEVIKETIKLISSTAYDRSVEKEADIKAVDYLLKSKINPEPFANFLFKLSNKESETSNYFTWISTHPESKERAEYIIEYSKNKGKNFEEIITMETWNRLKDNVYH